MRIIIYGSRPGALAVAGDVVYFVNGSIRDRALFPAEAKVIHIVANRGVQNGLSETKRKTVTHVIDGFRDASADKTILVGLGEFEPTVSGLQEIGYTTDEYSFVPIRDRDVLVRAITRVSLPTGLRFSFHWGFKRGLKSLKSLIKSVYLRRKYRTNEFDWDIMYRPSNGVFALLHALSSFGSDNEFILSGVGLDAWNYGYQNADGEFLKRRKKRPHLLADYAILRAVAKSNVWTDDRLLSERTGIRFLGEHGELGELVERIDE